MMVLDETRETTAQDMLDFIHEYGDVAYLGPDDLLLKRLDWFLCNRRLFIGKSKGRIMTLVAFAIVDSPAEVIGKWPEDDVS